MPIGLTMLMQNPDRLQVVLATRSHAQYSRFRDFAIEQFNDLPGLYPFDSGDNYMKPHARPSTTPPYIISGLTTCGSSRFGMTSSRRHGYVKCFSLLFTFVPSYRQAVNLHELFIQLLGHVRILEPTLSLVCPVHGLSIVPSHTRAPQVVVRNFRAIVRTPLLGTRRFEPNNGKVFSILTRQFRPQWDPRGRGPNFNMVNPRSLEQGCSSRRLLIRGTDTALLLLFVVLLLAVLDRPHNIRARLVTIAQTRLDLTNEHERRGVDSLVRWMRSVYLQQWDEFEVLARGRHYLGRAPPQLILRRQQGPVACTAIIISISQTRASDAADPSALPVPIPRNDAWRDEHGRGDSDLRLGGKRAQACGGAEFDAVYRNRRAWWRVVRPYTSAVFGRAAVPERGGMDGWRTRGEREQRARAGGYWGRIGTFIVRGARVGGVGGGLARPALYATAVWDQHRAKANRSSWAHLASPLGGLHSHRSSSARRTHATPANARERPGVRHAYEDEGGAWMSWAVGGILDASERSQSRTMRRRPRLWASQILGNDSTKGPDPGGITFKSRASQRKLEERARIRGGASTWHGRSSALHLSLAPRVMMSSPGVCILPPDKRRDARRMCGALSAPASLLSPLRRVPRMRDVEATGGGGAGHGVPRPGDFYC
ncbi:hypothetical protein B0H17DRAFT_1149017 [Mycena rosella]|uniref:Uncharacterized protein n=1 Tax=Mycena rosella TaxID=1033263 RepID=A0AAD7FSG5_MYCRO|nr:hypothetical protein B0H17DRAFT_1149017 [Mycena rosella]